MLGFANANFEETSIMKQVKGNYTVLTIAPWFHVMGFIGLLMSLTLVELSTVYLSRFEPELFLRSIQVIYIFLFQSRIPYFKSQILEI